MSLVDNQMPIPLPNSAPPVDNGITGPIQAPPPTAAPPQAPPAPDQKPPFWKTLLQGALAGLAGSAGSKTFGGGLGAGAAGEINEQQRQVTNNMNVRFANLQDAKQAADLTHQMTEQQHWGDEQKTRNDQLALQKAQFFKNSGYKVTPLQRSPDAVMTFLATNGGTVHPYTFNDSNTIYAVTPGEDNGWKGSNSLAAAIGAAPIAQDMYNRMSPQQRFMYEKSVNDRLAKMSPKEIDAATDLYSKTPNADPDAINVLKTQRQLAQAGQDNKEGLKDKQAARQLTNNVASAQARNDYRGKDVFNPETGYVETVHTKDAIAGHMSPATSATVKAQTGIGLLNEIDAGANNARSAITGLKQPFTADQQIQLATALSHGSVKKFLGISSLSPDQKSYVTAINSLREGAMSYRGIAGQGSGSDQQRQALFDALPNPLQPVDMQIAALDRFDQQRNAIRASIPKVHNNAVPNQPAGAQPQHTPGAQAGLQEGATGTGTDNKKYVVKGGVWVPQ